MLYANGVADAVGPASLRSGSVHWGDPGASGQLVGNYFANGTFGKVADPQCNLVAASLKSSCTLLAVTNAANGDILFQNPQPGKRGTVGRQTIENPGSWDLDANVSKTFRISESKSVQVRLDGTNITNHPVPNNPTLSINSTSAFGLVQTKTTAHRQFQGQLRFSF